MLSRGPHIFERKKKEGSARRRLRIFSTARKWRAPNDFIRPSDRDHGVNGLGTTYCVSRIPFLRSSLASLLQSSSVTLPIYP
jgi:hypothetical protein